LRENCVKARKVTTLTAKPRTFSSKTIWIITAIIIVILAAFGGYVYYTRFRSTTGTNTFSSTNQTTAVARRGDLIVSATGQGTLIAQTSATFGFKTDGQVTAVNIKIGDQVQAGQVLAQVDDTLQQMKYAEAQQALQELYSAAAIANVEKEIATAQDSEFQARTWLTYLISPDVVDAEENLAIAQQKLTDAQAEAKATPSTEADQKVKQAQESVTYLQQVLDQAWVTYKNVYGPDNFTEYTRVGGRRGHQVVVTTTDPVTGEEVPKIDWPSDADVATARNNYAQAKQTVKDDQAYLQTLNTGVIPEGATGALYTTLYRAHLAVTNAQADLDKTKLTAPIAGTVTALNIHLGEQGNTTSAITISQLDQPYTLDAYISENDWSSAKLGNDVDVTFNLLPDKSFPGIVTVVYPNLDTSSEEPLIHILVQLDQSISQVLPAGTGASLTVVGGEANNAILLPTNMVHQTSAGTYEVFVLQNGQKIKKQVEVGLRGTAYVEIKSGLNAGEIVTAQ
jgi:HlyD family secretion protein